MTKLPWALTVFVIFLIISNTFASNYSFDIEIKMDKKRQESIRKNNIEENMEIYQNDHLFYIQKYSLFKYLREKKGKVPIFLDKYGYIQLEIGVSGYFGIKLRF